MNSVFKSIIGIISALLVFNLMNMVATTHNDHWRRNKLINEERLYEIGNNVSLSALEKKVNRILMKAKNHEMLQGLKDSEKFLPAYNFLVVKDRINDSKVFKFMKKMPKGAVLHSHDIGIVSDTYVYWNITHRDNLYACRKEASWHLKFFKTPDENCQWQLLEKLRKNKTLAGELNEHIKNRLTMTVKNPEQVYTTIEKTWSKFQGIFGFVYDMLTYLPVFQDYMYQGLLELYEDNVMYLELRTTLPLLYELNGEQKTQEDTVKILKEINDRFVKDHPGFLGFKIIYAPQRNVNDDELSQHLNLARDLVQKYPNFVIGFDLVGREDNSGSLKNMTRQLELHRRDLEYFFHAGETNWNGMDTDENLFDAVLLKVKRIGHGYAITKHPKLMQRVKKLRIAIEVNPISNQVLHLVKDMRNHPACVLFANDYPVVVSNDDPGLWGATGLSYDFYEAFMGIMSAKADLKSLKQLALNSIEYSSLNEHEKTQARATFDNKWNDFLNGFQV